MHEHLLLGEPGDVRSVGGGRKVLGHCWQAQAEDGGAPQHLSIPRCDLRPSGASCLIGVGLWVAFASLLAVTAMLDDESKDAITEMGFQVNQTGHVSLQTILVVAGGLAAAAVVSGLLLRLLGRSMASAILLPLLVAAAIGGARSNARLSCMMHGTGPDFDPSMAPMQPATVSHR